MKHYNVPYGEFTLDEPMVLS